MYSGGRVTSLAYSRIKTYVVVYTYFLSGEVRERDDANRLTGVGVRRRSGTRV